MSKSNKRALLLVLLVVFLTLQGWAAFFQHDGGIVAKYSFTSAFTEYVNISLQDPLFTAGLIDFLTIMGILLVWLIAELPNQHRWKGKTFVWIAAFCVYPGLGLFLYLLWLNPDHPIMRDKIGAIN